MTERTDGLVTTLCWIAEVARHSYENDPKLRANSARTLKRIADRADEALSRVSQGEKS